ncbi:hypothetical protein AN618_03940 [Fervidicola ferrireducens]|uniref:DUF3467 domain-containing protein n=1 Tax=Fervidicola ferrireducens TaxID=520764 RepID=A0A140LCQ3_9FIRM|nr:DUF3467 domain-containing protein [Fervidicola ferrireducens]KXG78328.1 hypothetical protein AN618_03940 [Fervidicola ferrireducens]
MDYEIKRSYYANLAQIELGFYDIRISFGEKKKRIPEITDEDIDVKIIMSPQHAKEFANLLMRNIKHYEEIFGEIKLPPSEDQNRKEI